MKKDFFKKALSLGLAATMLFSVQAFGAAATPPPPSENAEKSTEIEAEADIKDGFISVVVPTEFDFAINKFEYKDAGSQIYSSDMPIINNSDVDVKVAVSIKATPAATNPPTILTNKSAVNQTDEKITTKQVYIELVPASDDLDLAQDEDTGVYGVVGSGGDNSDAITWSTTNYTVAKPASAITATSPATKIDFYLEKAVWASAAPTTPPEPDVYESPDDNGFTAVRLKGVVNPFADYEENDVKVTLSFKLSGLAASMYTEATLEDMGVYNCDMPPSVANVEVDLNGLNSDTVISFSPGKGALAATGALGTTWVGVKTGNAAEANIIGSGVTLSAANKTITLTSAKITALGVGTHDIIVYYGTGTAAVKPVGKLKIVNTTP